MKRLLPLCITIAFLLMSAGCHSAMSTPSDRPVADLLQAKPGYSNAINHWPLVFRGHWFDVATYSTYGCRVLYGAFFTEDPEDKLQISSASLGRKYPDRVLRAGWGPIPNFPSPAVVGWRSADGTPHHAEIDIGEIFKDQLVRHNVPREEASGYDPQPQIILEVNDRTINVYMRAVIFTKHEQIPGNKYSDMRHDLIKVFSRTY